MTADIPARLARLFSGDYSRASVPAGRIAELLVLAGADPDALRELPLTSDTLVLAPRSEAPSRRAVRGALVLAYDDEFRCDGGIDVRRESYTVAPFLPPSAATVAAVLTPDDLANLLEDADVAVATGAFEDFLLHPSVVLGDVCALGGGCAGPQRSRAVLDAGGLRPALGGRRFASTCTCLDAVVAPATLHAARAQRPWLPRYLAVLGVLRALRRRESGPIHVSGFGHRFVDGVPARPLEPATAPVLMRAGDQYLICDPASRRVLRTGPDAIRVLEAALGGAERVAERLNLATGAASAAVSQVQDTLERLQFPLGLAEAA